MAVQLINDMPDAQVHRGEPLRALLQDFVALRPQRSERSRFGGRAGFIFATVAVHVVAVAGFLTARHGIRNIVEPEPIIASLIESPTTEEAPPEVTPPLQAVAYALPTPQDLSFDSEAISIAPAATTSAITNPSPEVVAPPLIDDVDYVRAEPPVYPKESQRHREHGTVILRVLIDVLGRPAQIQVERSSGFARLDAAGRAAAEKFLFRPHTVNGIAQPAQVLIPIEFARRAT